MSVESTGTGRVQTTGSGLPTVTGAWTFGFWFRLVSYANTFEQVFVWVNSGSGDQLIGADTSETVDTALDGFVAHPSGTPTFDHQSILTGSDTTWSFLGGSYPGSGTTYKLRLRKELSSTWSTKTFTTGQVINPTEFFILSDGFSNANTRVRSFFLQATEMNDATLLTASSSLSAPAGTNTTFLALNDHTTAGTNTGTGANWTVNGTLTTQSGDDPNPALSTASGLLLTASDRINRNTLLRL